MDAPWVKVQLVPCIRSVDFVPAHPPDRAFSYLSWYLVTVHMCICTEPQPSASINAVYSLVTGSLMQGILLFHICSYV